MEWWHHLYVSDGQEEWVSQQFSRNGRGGGRFIKQPSVISPFDIQMG